MCCIIRYCVYLHPDTNYHLLGESEVQTAFATTIYSYPKRPIVVASAEDNLDDAGHLGSMSEVICVLEEHVLRIYYENGEDQRVAIPFVVKKCWPSK